VGKGRHGGDSGRLLSSTQRASRDENTCILAGEASRRPETTSGVNERLPLSREVAITSGDAEEEGVERGENVRGDDWIVGFGWSVHFGEDLAGEGLGNLVDGDSSASTLDTGFDGLGHFSNMAVHGVDDDSDLGRHF